MILSGTKVERVSARFVVTDWCPCHQDHVRVFSAVYTRASRSDVWSHVWPKSMCFPFLRLIPATATHTRAHTHIHAHTYSCTHAHTHAGKHTHVHGHDWHTHAQSWKPWVERYGVVHPR